MTNEKVYCKDCEYLERVNSFNPSISCNFIIGKTEEDTPISKYTKIDFAYSSIHNKENHCPYFLKKSSRKEPCKFKKILNFLFG